jgi:hypothetical protein
MCAVSSELLPQVLKFLEEWRGQAPDPSAFAAATNRIPCMQCSEKCVVDSHIFSRSDCEAKLQSWRAGLNQIRAQRQVADEIDGTSDQCRGLTETCRHGHTSTVEDILSHNVIYSAVPCPCCVQGGQVPPFCFSRCCPAALAHFCAVLCCA